MSAQNSAYILLRRLWCGFIYIYRPYCSLYAVFEAVVDYEISSELDSGGGVVPEAIYYIIYPSISGSSLPTNLNFSRP
jgi:hypothetical protein